MRIYKKALLLTAEQMRIVEEIQYRKSPGFLGDFGYFANGERFNTGTLPESLHETFERMKEVTSCRQEFNQVFIQRYLTGQRVVSHRDPYTNKGVTLILVQGKFQGATFNYMNSKIDVDPGDILKLPCTIHGVQGPVHSVDPVFSGVKYSLILNTIR